MVRYHLKCCVIVNALIECKIAFFKVVRQSLKSFYKMAKERGSGWYRSKEPVPVYDAFVGAGYLSNKTWPLQEESSYNNMITFSMNGKYTI